MANLRSISSFLITMLFFATVSAKGFLEKRRSKQKPETYSGSIENMVKTLRDIQQIFPATEKSMNGQKDGNLDIYLAKKRDEVFEKIRNTIKFSKNCPNRKIYYFVLEKLVVLNNWKVDNLTANFINNLTVSSKPYIYALNCATMAEHRIESNTSFYMQKCGHRICFNCIVEYLKIHFLADDIFVKCQACGSAFPFYVDSFVFRSPKMEQEKQLVFNEMPNLFYCKDSKATYKKCNTLLCKNIIAIAFPKSYNKHFYFGIECADGHVQCAYCGFSFDHSPLKCQSIYLIEAFDGFIWKKKYLKLRFWDKSKKCKKCKRKMALVDPSKIKDQEVLKLFLKASIFICSYCKHVEANDTARSSNPFHQALLSFQTSSNDKNSLVFKNYATLKNGYLYLLMILQPMNNENEDDNDIEDEDEEYSYRWMLIINNKKQFVNLFFKFLDFFRQDIEKYSLVSEDSDSLQETSNLLKRLIDSTIARFEQNSKKNYLARFDEIFEFVQNKQNLNVEELSMVQVKEHLKNFFGETAAQKLIRPSFTALQQNEDPLKSAVIILKQNTISRPEVTEKFKNSTGKNISDADFERMIRTCTLDHNAVLHILEKRLDEFLDECDIKRLKECAVCYKKFETSGSVIPECNHDPMCKNCTKKAFEQHHESNYINTSNGLVRCFQDGCKEVFHPSVIKNVFGKNSEQWKRFDKHLLRRFEKALEEEILLKCPNCKIFFEIDKKLDILKGKDSLFNASYAVNNRMLLQTFECPNCSYSMCVNCKQQDLHFSTVCGKSLEIDVKNCSMMCPGCKNYGSRVAACPEMTCPVCGTKFCFACGVCEKFTDCINKTYPAAYYSGEFNIRRIEAYHSQLQKALKPVIDNFNQGKTAIITEFESLVQSKIKCDHRLLMILKKACLFRNWHILLLNYIEESSLAKNKSTIENCLTLIETHSNLAISQLESSEQDTCIETCRMIVNEMKNLDDLVKALPISNMILLTDSQFNEYKIEAEKINQEEKNAALLLEQQLPVQVVEVLNNESGQEVGKQPQPLGPASPNDLIEQLEAII